MSKHIHILVCAVVVSAAGCGLIGEPDSRRDALGHDDVISTSPTGDDGMVCEYPSVLTGARHSVDLRDCFKLEGGQLGEDMTFDVNGESVTVSDWQTKEGEGDYIGFHVDGDVIIVVKAGTDLHEAGEGTWVHPAGTEGPNAKGISFVAFCEPPTDEPVCTPTGDGDPSGGGGPGGSGDPSGGDGGITPSGGGDDGSGDGGGGEDDSGYCDPYTCEPGGGSYGGGDNDGSGSDGSESGGDGSGSGGDGSGSGGDGSGSGGDGGTSGGDGGACAVTSCGTDNICPDNHACYSGCCVEVIL